MMGEYLLRLIPLLLLVAGMAVGSLWLWRKVQPGMALGGNRPRAVRVVDAVPMGATSRLAVVEFGGRHLLLAVSRGGITLIAEGEPGTVTLPDANG
ncbi:FliO/MopB family protein [Sphingomonas jatrophae]|uniref:Flagellar protein FliO/FliZ n=1 Tax=Sphingomonas jatrophae TaxID=1166337 RepID=A0A1I6MB50_9SPHN|nr:flagellar biosynthetic protein FliO [Sphingomonas jatrophae]SFS12956.1 flagellar protein FliO/FliZ [Sphingomonas jatrophae]